MDFTSALQLIAWSLLKVVGVIAFGCWCVSLAMRCVERQ